ncbi:MAG: hypothetical protein Q8L78_01005 [Coxiellaceae bacterium]|nr:hypothetical protein [Coxiellaceae bacterium]
MINYFLKILTKKLGLNQAILFSIGLRGWQTLAGLVTLFLIAHFFTPIQQGFFYTFNSLLMLQIFFEMGFSYVLIQFNSHEFAHLKWARLGRVSGGKKIQRFKVLLAKSLHWYFWSAILFIIITVPIGLYFLGLKSTNLGFYWRSPWVFLVLMTGINLLLMPFLSCIEGSGQVREVYRLRFFQNVCGTCVAWLVILLHGGLYNAVALSTATALISFFWLFKNRPGLLRIATDKKIKKLFSADLLCWKTEIWPMQWRIAISWISGYFINQIFVPILFYYKNPIVAGQMGMSLAISTMLVFVGQAWISAKAPMLGKIVAKGDWAELDSTFYRLVKQSSAIVLLSCFGFISVVMVFQYFPIAHRLLPPFQLCFLVGSAFISHFINCIAQYLRSHKQEPFMILSVIGAILIANSAWFFGKYYSSEGIVIAVFLINLVYGLPSAIWLWRKKRKLWHHLL